MSRTLLILTLSAASAAAQLTATVGPVLAPLGSPIVIAISNDSGSPVTTGVCPYNVTTLGGVSVFVPICPSVVQTLPPGTTFFTTWNQRDSSGLQVPPGVYLVNVMLPDASQVQQSLALGGAEMGLAHLGAPHLGTHRNLLVTAPGEAGRPFLLAAALGFTTGFATCGGAVLLDPDALFFYSLGPNPVFLNFGGFLDSQGLSTSPSLNIPSAPELVGATVLLGGVTYDPLSPCPIRAIAPPLVVSIF